MRDTNKKEALPSLGVAIIVKDAAATIERAMFSVAALASQVVVVDTGSADNTAAIAARHGAEVHFHRWQNDFSEARNYCLSLMRTQWTLSLDADEELLPAFGEQVLDFLGDSSLWAVRLPIENLLPDGLLSTHSYPRLFRNCEEVRYQGRIHEQILCTSSKFSGTIPSLEKPCIRHYGYQQESQERHRRNSELLTAALQEQPNDSFLLYHQASTAFAQKDITKAQQYFEDALKLGNLSPEQEETASLRLLQIALAQEQYSTVLLHDKHFANADRRGFAAFLKAIALLSTGDSTTALQLLKLPEVAASSLVVQSQREELIRSLTRS